MNLIQVLLLSIDGKEKITDSFISKKLTFNQTESYSVGFDTIVHDSLQMNQFVVCNNKKETPNGAAIFFHYDFPKEVVLQIAKELRATNTLWARFNHSLDSGELIVFEGQDLVLKINGNLPPVGYEVATTEDKYSKYFDIRSWIDYWSKKWMGVEVYSLLEENNAESLFLKQATIERPIQELQQEIKNILLQDEQTNERLGEEARTFIKDRLNTPQAFEASKGDAVIYQFLQPGYSVPVSLEGPYIQANRYPYMKTFAELLVTGTDEQLQEFITSLFYDSKTYKSILACMLPLGLFHPHNGVRAAALAYLVIRLPEIRTIGFFDVWKRDYLKSIPDFKDIRSFNYQLLEPEHLYLTTFLRLKYSETAIPNADSVITLSDSDQIKIVDEDLIRLFKEVKLVNAIGIIKAEMNQLYRIKYNIPSIRKLTISSCGLIMVPQYMNELKHLEALDLSNNPLDYLLKPNLPQVRVLNLAHTKVNEMTVKTIPNIQEIILSDETHLTAFRLTDINLLPKNFKYVIVNSEGKRKEFDIKKAVFVESDNKKSFWKIW
ncbi:MAG: hypothetical protein U0U66_02880 [Cytophagaceae bacterium]